MLSMAPCRADKMMMMICRKDPGISGINIGF
jgi:hypothetical protein